MTTRKIAIGAMLLGFVLVSPLSAKKPAAADEAAIRAMIEQLYAPQPDPPADAPDETADDSDLDYTHSLDALATRWEAAMAKVDDVYSMNDFDWYCQCQDKDPASAKLVRQSYKLVGKDRIDADVLYSPGNHEGRTTGEPLIFRFRREDGAWKLDDLKFHKFMTLRQGLASDIRDAEKDLAKKPKAE